MAALKAAVILALAAVLPSLFVSRSPVASQDPESVRRGQYVFQASGGCSCHSDPGSTSASPAGPAGLAGGRPIKTPFGTIYGTNITPEKDTGIGGWTDEDFLRAMREGLSPSGEPYYP